MELARQGSSETSSEENNDRQEKVNEDKGTTTTTKRFYECTFCKKGFDNAQALGGHMNIHRGAKSKAKQGTSSSLQNKSSEEYFDLNYMGPISSQLPRDTYYPFLEARNNYHMYFQPSGSSPSQPYGYNHHSSVDFLGVRPQSFSMNDEGLWGSNLSLRIGSGHPQDNDITRGVVKEDEVDLELRLGHIDRC